MRILSKLLLSTLILLSCLIVAECAQRLSFYGWGGFSPTRLASVRPLGETGFTTDSPFPDIAYRLRPGIRDWYLLYPFETSSQGLRDREYTLEKPANTFRVAVVGDSYTMGSGVPIEKVFHSVIEERLNARSTELDYEFINFGVGGYSLLHELAVIEHEVLPWNPDLILLAVISNDAPPPSIAYLRKLFPDHPGIAPRGDRPLPPPAPTSYWRLTLLDQFLKPEPEFEPREVEAPEQARPSVTRDELGIRAVLGVDAQLTGEEEYMAVVFERMRELAESAEARVFCTYLTTSDTQAMRGFAAEFEAAAGGVGFGFLDTCDLLTGMDRKDVVIFPDDGHPNARVHALYAQALEAALVSGGWLDPR